MTDASGLAISLPGIADMSCSLVAAAALAGAAGDAVIPGISAIPAGAGAAAWPAGCCTTGRAGLALVRGRAGAGDRVVRRTAGFGLGLAAGFAAGLDGIFIPGMFMSICAAAGDDSAKAATVASRNSFMLRPPHDAQ